MLNVIFQKKEKELKNVFLKLILSLITRNPTLMELKT